MRDHLLDWITVRAQVPWVSAATPGTGPVTGGRDGVLDHVRTTVAARDPRRADRLLAALRQSRDAATAGATLSLEVLAGWQAVVLGAPSGGFRAGAAFAKDGREHYGLRPDTEDRFRSCLAEATDPLVPPSARAARVYLDVAFFHPFADGNARAAMLCLDFVLRRDRVTIDLAAPLLRTARRADDADGAADLVRLLDVLIAATRRRSAALLVSDDGPRIVRR